jgi:hypothetical protein
VPTAYETTGRKNVFGDTAGHQLLDTLNCFQLGGP